VSDEYRPTRWSQAKEGDAMKHNSNSNPHLPSGSIRIGGIAPGGAR
jgi:hypothetical protein